MHDRRFPNKINACAVKTSLREENRIDKPQAWGAVKKPPLKFLQTDSLFPSPGGQDSKSDKRFFSLS